MNYKLPEMSSNKFMYVKQNLIDSIEKNIQPKVLINPQFVQVSLVKPHFNKQFLLNQKIHVNPNMLKPRVEQPKITKPVVPNKAIVTTPTKLIRVPQKDVLVQTRMKLIRVSNPRIENGRRTSIHTQYKIIRDPQPIKQESQLKKLHYVKNRFRVDHRSQKLIRSSLNKKTKNISNLKSIKSQYVSINGRLFRRSSKSLVTVNRKTKINRLSTKKRRKEQLLTIRGQKYKLDSNHRTLTLLKEKDEKPNFKTVYIGKVAFKQKEPNVFVKINTSKRILLSQGKPRLSTNKLKISNMPCPFYRKFGKCKGKESGTCIRQHNPEQVSLCPKFLQGACVNNKCLLSHKVSAEKMPTCKFFLEGLCSKDDCPYLHVKINAKAEICKDFVEGFCRKAAECDKRHQYLCPDFEKNGSCAKKKCQYPHGNLVRKRRVSKTIASKLQELVRNKNISNVKNHPVLNRKTKVNKPNSDLEKALNVRYYDESTPSSIKASSVQKESDKLETVDLDSEQIDTPVKKRPTVGNLPSFIPF